MSDNKEPFNIKDIQDNFNEQQAKILALREVVRRTESENKANTSHVQEKIRNIAQCLTNIKSKSKQRQSLDRSVSNEVISISEEDERSPRIQQPNSRKSETKEKFQLLREQLEKNKLKIAERESNKKDIEEMVVKLKAEINTTQESLNRSSELGRSMSDLSSFHAPAVGSKHKSSLDLSSTPQFNIDKERIKFLENRIRQLEKENQKPKTKSTILNESAEAAEEIKRLEAKIIDLNENLHEKECVIEARTKAITLMTESLSAKGKTTVDMLEDTKTEMFQMQKNFLETEDTYRSEISRLKADIDILNNKVINLNEVNNILETSRFEFTMKNSKLENDIQKEIMKNQELNSTILELELKISEYNENAVDHGEQKFKKNIGEEYAEKLQCLEDKIQEIQLENNQLKDLTTNTSFTEIITDDQSSLEKIKLLENLINEQNEKIQQYLRTTEEQEQSILEKTTENKVLEANMLVLEEKLKSKAPRPLFSDTELKEDDGEVNRLKQQLDESNKIMIKMKIKTKQLQKEIEKFKKTSNINAELVELTEKTHELSQRIVELEDEKGQLLLKLINNDEEKTDSEKKFGEKDSEHNEELTKLDEVVKLLNNKNLLLQNDKDDLQSKINHYIAENIDLLDKIEKFNKSSSSAESIEIVERLTQCEKREIEKYNLEASRNLKDSAKTDASMGQELSDSLIKLREESAELMHKVELFTLERKEVLEKMEILSNENQDNLNTIEVLEGQKKALENKIEQIEKDKINLAVELENTTLSLPANVVDLLEKSEKSLQKLKIEIDNYKKVTDKNAKFNCSKKLAKEALNTYKQVEECIKKIKEISKMECESNIPKQSANKLIDSSEFLSQIENLQKDLINLQNDNSSKDIEIDKLKTEIDTLVNAQITQSVENPTEHKGDSAEYVIQINNLQNDLSKVETENSSKNLEITNLKAELEALVSSKKAEEIETDKIDSTKYLDQIESLEKELQNLQNENSSKDNEVKNLTSKITTLEQEIIIFKNLIGEQKDQLLSIISENEKEMELKSNELNKYKIQLKSFKINNAFERENEKLHVLNKSNQLELENKQLTINALNDQINELYRSMEDKANELYAKHDEIAVIEEKLITSQNKLEILSKENFGNKQVNEKLLTELHSHKEHLPIQIEYDNLAKENQNLKEIVDKMENTNKELITKNTEQMDKLKKFAANLKKKVSQCQQLESKIVTLEKNNAISDSSERIQNLEVELTNVMQSFKTEKDYLIEQLNVKSNELNSLKNDFNECLVIIKQINLDLINYKQLIPNVLQTLNVKQADITESKNKIKESANENASMIVENRLQLQKIDKCKTIIKEKNTEIKRLTNELTNLQQIMARETQSNVDCEKYNVLQNNYATLKDLHEKLLITYNDEKNSFQETVSKLEILHNGIQAKLQENSAYIEILETENNGYKEKIYKLENCVSTFEERRLSLEKRTNVLNDELKSKTTEFEKNEDALIYRLNMLSDHDDVIGSRLLAIEEQNEDLIRKLDDIKQDHSDLTAKYLKVEKEYTKLKSDNQDKEKMLVDEVNEVKMKYENQKHEYEEKISRIQKDFEELENDYCIQLERIQDEKKNLTVSKEKLIDEINYYKDENVKLKETVNSLEQSKNDFERDITWIRMQNENLSQDQFELEQLRLNTAQAKNHIDELTQQLETITNNSESEINQLRLELHELNVNKSITNRTDDQVLIESENNKLKELLTEKDNAIEMYQRQNLQLQMCNFSIPSNTGDIFPNEVETLRDKCNQFETTIAHLKEVCDNKNKHVEILQTELIQLNSLKSSNQANSAVLDSTSSAWDNINIIDTDELIMPEIQKNKLQTGVFTTTMDTDYEKIQIAALQEKVLELEKYITKLENKIKANSTEQTQKTPNQPELSNFFNMAIPSSFDTFSNNMPTEVIEDAIVPKTAYLCYENDPETGIVQQTHSMSQSSQITDAQKLEDLIHELKLEVKRAEDEKQTMQIKSGKMMKKLKEYKSKIEQLEQRSSKSSSVELNDLDLAIQDEMKLQLKQSEQKISEQKIKLDKEILEKEKLLKRIEVLADANDRMIEIKEKKDIEHQILQNNITELNRKIKALEDWSDEKPEYSNYDNNTVLKAMPDVKEIENLRLKIDDIQLDRDEIQQLLDEEYMQTKNLQLEITALKNKIIILENNDEKSSSDIVQQNNILKSEITNLNETNTKLLNDVNILRDENSRIISENLRLTSANENVVEQNNECLQCINLKEQLNVLNKKCFDNITLIEYREMEIIELKQEIDRLEKQDQTASLVQEILLKNQDILALKNQVFGLIQQNDELENNITLQITKEVSQNSEKLNIQHQQDISEKSGLIEKLLKEKQDMESELKELNDFILKDPNHSASLGKSGSENPFAEELNYYKNVCNQLTVELEDLKEKCAQSQETNLIKEHSIDNDLILWKQKCEQLTIELAHIKENENNTINVEQTDKSGRDTSDEMIENMRKVLENQELEIVTLKEQLAVRSAEFAKLAAQYDPYALQSSSSAFLSQKISPKNDEIKQSELNLYLYLIHQKDMRCEELTLELVSLLEERDTLQLTLSDSIRKMEEIKLKTGYNDEDNKSNISSIKPSSSSSDNSPEKKPLNEKLSQLHSIGYMKDKTIYDNRGSQIETFQQDIANIPLEAVSEIVGEDLAKSNQSPSAVLLSWLWGKPNTNSDNS